MSESNAELLPAAGSGETPTITKFQSLVGRLLWVASCTRPDIAFAVHKPSRRTHCPTIADWKLAKRILRYLSGTKSLSLLMGGDSSVRRELEVIDYSDADFAADKLDRKSVTGGFITMDAMAVGWTCKKQGGVALSTMEAEYTAASMIGQEILGIRGLLGELEVACVQPVEIRVDNQAALTQIEGEKASSKAKPIYVRIKFVVHYTKKGVLKPQYWKSGCTPADVFTKVLAAPRIDKLRTFVGLH
ncbi:hypothetical protein PC129_g7245 [Phytophthora cactorum]|uniref:Reverse transcriptase Ty1/copia-type domain-containing protein n=2 Tax=Phytophthora cactorum TaxID=29920 RepID=A0A8T1CII2_9STRA|nr:hypothetical protein Pcac1_g17693 [Phytophthora cactorum]KAG2826960.1 hypothetical protein PC112_g9067 [Phytophthora cactorum]KAG2828963.1 hypothetical protein PC111_g7970 [Phytophthora cactorum]KAG2858876.1 hypothetical protein PC113_g9413 [Phytophthora cactorum]KAG2908004.1 hypothetical protein PC114_g10652 [Phytophthora cactorum]